MVSDSTPPVDRGPMAEPPGSSAPRGGESLARTMRLGALIVYGVGDMLGSGTYALILRARVSRWWT